ncbi:MAG: hypothetical protein PHY56_00495 [Candidatus Omnitrophica bacterium]|nr:hypothetical protein [Candidatus Omnitrophota bacterium]
MAQQLKDSKGNPITGKDGKEIYIADMLALKNRRIVKEVNAEKRTLTIIGTDETRDRDGDIISINGWEMANFLTNPVFLWAHDYSSVPIAAAVKVIRKREPAPHMVFTEQFAPEGIFPFADMIFELYKIKQINASSVGFMPYSWEKIEDKDSEEGGKYQYRSNRKFTKQELLELSGCAVPANPSALQMAMKSFSIPKGINADKVIDYIIGKEAPMIDLNREDDWNEEIDKIKKQTEFVDETDSTIFQLPDDLENKNQDNEDKEIDYLLNTKFPEVELIGFDPDNYDLIGKKEMKPYPNEHACRLESPDDFDKFARKNCGIKSDGKCIDVIYGIKGNKSTVQAMRYSKDIWDKDAAKNHCKDHKGSFEAAGEASFLDTNTLVCPSCNEAKVGAVLSAKNKNMLVEAQANIQKVLDAATPIQEQDSIEDTDHTDISDNQDSKSNGVKDDLFDTILADEKKPEEKQVEQVDSKELDVERIQELTRIANVLKGAVDLLTKIQK